jgi:hypothetical protein
MGLPSFMYVCESLRLWGLLFFVQVLFELDEKDYPSGKGGMLSSWQ